MCSLRASVAGLGLVVSVLVPTLAIAAEAPSARKSVLLLYAESRVVPAILRVDESIRSRFATAGVEAEFFPEYLDLSWAAEPGHTNDVLAFLRSKHRHRWFDIVMAAGSTALRFALANRAELFPGVPIVFCAVTRAGTDGLHLGRDVTGVWMVPEAAATVAAAVHLQPTARQLVIVGGPRHSTRSFWTTSSAISLIGQMAWRSRISPACRSTACGGRSPPFPGRRSSCSYRCCVMATAAPAPPRKRSPRWPGVRVRRSMASPTHWPGTASSAAE
jgi:hypothetical protein